MQFGRCHFRDLDAVIDHLHERVQAWVAEATDTAADIDVELLHRLELISHEWLANLVQHADFAADEPCIVFEVEHAEGALRGLIEDNSAGFDLDGKIDEREDALEALPERGMGLLMLRACTVDLSYERSADANRLTFQVSQEQDPWLDLPFS